MISEDIALLMKTIKEALGTVGSDPDFSYRPEIREAKQEVSPLLTGLQEALIGGRRTKGDANLLQALQRADADMRAQGLRGLQITSDFRTREQQEAAYNRYLSGKGGIAAKPGRSRHERGLAVDIANWQEAQRFLRKYGLSNPIPKDEVHFQFS